MSALENALMRTVSRHLGRAIPIRETSALSSDPEGAIGIVTIKIVTEEHVQAIAFGSFDGPPIVITRLNPLGRDASDLAPFARFLGNIADEVIAGDRELRIWVPHGETMETIDLLGHRYWRNDQAPAEIVRMGELCRVIAHEATIPGQQLVANASEALRAHITTGQTPIEDGHLGALLAWLDPTCRDPLRVGRERIRIPASGVLPNTPDRPDDDNVDRLRKVAKNSTGARRAYAEREIEDILRRAVLREWELLVEARNAFLGLRLPSLGLDALAKASRERVTYGMSTGHFPARQAHSLAIELEIMEAGQQLAEQAALENDVSWREKARRAGRAILGTITVVDQTRPKFKPCSITVDTTQAVVRPRRDDKIKLVGTNVTGFVRHIDVNPNGGARLTIEIENGVRSTAVLSVGVQVEVIDRGFGFASTRPYAIAHDRQPWQFYGADAPILAAGNAPATSALALARARRRA
jgi:hypothetical protein